ncbi:DUF2388 domain-containing protein [Stutzerimonas tarimensis]|uniref:DUF2388 domain-containing protein n=1 Tax=Stutzerimonas tarimensis TaxID=1507735 RepID=A0ABV7T4R1_9GAMM
MKTSLLALGTAALLLAGPLSAASFVATTDVLVRGTVDITNATTRATAAVFGDDKVVLDARDDAARYVASEGAQRGAFLEAALVHIRGKLPELQADDGALAEAILML